MTAMRDDREPARLKRIVSKFRNLRVVVLGDLMLDRYIWGTAHRLSPEAAVPIVDFKSQNDFLGGAGNVAANLRGLGARVEAFGVVGGRHDGPKKIVDDEPGAVLRSRLHKEAIEEKSVIADPRRVTTVKTRVIARQQQIVRVDQEQTDGISSELEEQLFRRLLASLKAADAVVLSDYDKGLISDTFTDRVLRACSSVRVPVFVKPKAARLIPYPGARAIICNTKEAETYAGRALRDGTAVGEAGSTLLGRFGSAAVIITRGAEGMMVFEEGSPRALDISATSHEVSYARVGQRGVERSAQGRQVFDVTGAGDTVLSALAIASVAGATIGQSAHIANVAAGVVVGKLGTATVRPDELSAALDEAHL